ncbi:hypothetical protein LOC51_35305 [Rubrivivax sp. JA1024]|nr:hypothetical protein [Rubrivivax sp. JA1024]
MIKRTDALVLTGVTATTPWSTGRRWLATRLRLSSAEAAFVFGAILLAALLILLAFLPAPHDDARLFSDGWGAESFVEGEACSPGDVAVPQLMPRPPVKATAVDRTSLALRYLTWGLLLPLLAATALSSRRVWVCRPDLVIVLLYGLVPAYLQWSANPAFVALRQTLADVWLQRWPMAESQIVWLDMISVALWHGGGLALGFAVWSLVAAAAALSATDRVCVARSLVPLGIVILTLGLTEASASYLRGEGVVLDVLPVLRATALAAGAVWSAVAGARAMRPLPVRVRSVAAVVLWALPIGLALGHGWWMYFEWTGRYRV